MSDRTQELKNLRAVATACKGYVDKSIDNLKWELGTYDLGIESDNTSALVKTMPSGTIKANINKIYGASEVSENLSIGTLNANINSSGVLESSSAYKVLIIEAKNGQTYYLQNNSYNQVVIGYFSSMPTIGSQAINNERIVIENTSSFIATSTNYVAVRFDINDTNASVVNYTGIHNLELSGLKVEGQNILNITDVSQTTVNGLIYKVINNEIYLNGTASADTNINLILSDNQYPISSIGLFNNVANSDVSFYNRTQNGSWGSIGFNLNTVNKTYTYNDNTNLYGFRLFIAKNAVISNMVIKPMLVRGTTAPTSYVPYITPTPLPIDLTSIEDSGGNKLFPNGKLMGYVNVKDVLGVYNQESKWNEYTFTGNETLTEYTRSNDNTKTYAFLVNGRATNTNVLFTPFSKTSATVMNNMENNSYRGATDTTAVIFYSTDYQTSASMLAFLTGKTIQFERATYLTSNTDLSATLRNIQGYSNGSITAQNTYDMAVSSEIDYLVEEAKA